MGETHYEEAWSAAPWFVFARYWSNMFIWLVEVLKECNVSIVIMFQLLQLTSQHGWLRSNSSFPGHKLQRKILKNWKLLSIFMLTKNSGTATSSLFWSRQHVCIWYAVLFKPTSQCLEGRERIDCHSDPPPCHRLTLPSVDKYLQTAVIITQIALLLIDFACPLALSFHLSSPLKLYQDTDVFKK